MTSEQPTRGILVALPLGPIVSSKIAIEDVRVLLRDNDMPSKFSDQVKPRRLDCSTLVLRVERSPTLRDFIHFIGHFTL